MKRKLLAVALLTIFGGTGAFAAQSGTEQFPVLAHFHDYGVVDAGVPSMACGLGGVPYHGRVLWGVQPPEDTWYGSSAWDGCLYATLVPGQVRAYVVETFTGYAVGCGSGTMTWILDGNINANFPPAPGYPLTQLHGSGPWKIDPNLESGGDLVGVQGQGFGVASKVQLTLENEGYFTGTIDCPRQ